MANVRISLVFFLVACIFNPRAFCLQCYNCKSTVSWADCEDRLKMETCQYPLDTCLKAHRIFHYPDGRRVHEFYKTCYYYPECNEESCRLSNDIVRGSWCEIECCNTTLCNAGVTPWARKHMPQTMLQVGGGGSHVTYTSANQIVTMLLAGLVFVF